MANWFDEGIKKSTGESLYFTEVEADENGRLRITYEGTFVEVPIKNGDLTTLPQWLSFASNSHTQCLLDISFGISPTYLYSDKVYQMTHNEVIATPRSSLVSQVTANHTTKLFLSTWNEHKGTHNQPVLIDQHSTNNLFVDLHGPELNYAWQRLSHTRDSYDDAGYNYFTGDRVICTWVRNDAAQRIELHVVKAGYTRELSDSAVDIYMVDCVSNGWLAVIPYSVLNNTAYFDPTVDTPPKRPDKDAPKFSGDTSGPGGGKGNYGNYPGEDIGFPELPTISAIDTGFLTMYRPTTAQLQSLVNYLWTSDWVETIKKMIANPMDAIISLQLAPYPVDSVVSSIIRIGGVSTEIPSIKVTDQYQILDCGSVSVPEHWGNSLDYNNVNIAIYLPFIGVRSLDTNLVMNSTVSLKYYVDLLTGSGIAMLQVSKNNTNKSVYYTYEANLNYQIPVTGANYSETIKALITMTGSAVGAGMSAASGNVAGALGATASMVGSAFMAGSGAHHFESSGSLSANTGLLGQYVPYIIVELPKQSLPRDFGHLKGYTSNITSVLGSLSGFTVVESVHVENIEGASDEEKAKIEELLKQGVII